MNQTGAGIALHHDMSSLQAYIGAHSPIIYHHRPLFESASGLFVQKPARVIYVLKYNPRNNDVCGREPLLIFIILPNMTHEMVFIPFRTLSIV